MKRYKKTNQSIIKKNNKQPPPRFSFLWKLLKQILNEATQKKVRVASSGSETRNALLEFVAAENIPVVRASACVSSRSFVRSLVRACVRASPSFVRVCVRVFIMQRRLLFA